jgi:large subunit ribosomal protein L6
MSRIGKKPVTIPSGVDVKADGRHVQVKGPLGLLARDFPGDIKVSIADGHIQISRGSDEREERAIHGLVRNEIQNMVDGVTRGFEKTLEINGVGYKVALAGRSLNFSLGRTNPIEYRLPEGIDAKVDKQTIVTIKGSSKALVGQTAANIRALKPPDVYKAKGIKYSGETLIRKAGKTAK